jgi:hypothetical protein
MTTTERDPRAPRSSASYAQLSWPREHLYQVVDFRTLPGDVLHDGGDDYSDSHMFPSTYRATANAELKTEMAMLLKPNGMADPADVHAVDFDPDDGGDSRADDGDS